MQRACCFLVVPLNHFTINVLQVTSYALCVGGTVITAWPLMAVMLAICPCAGHTSIRCDGGPEGQGQTVSVIQIPSLRRFLDGLIWPGAGWLGWFWLSIIVVCK